MTSTTGSGSWTTILVTAFLFFADAIFLRTILALFVFDIAISIPICDLNQQAIWDLYARVPCSVSCFVSFRDLESLSLVLEYAGALEFSPVQPDGLFRLN